jgi:hypothetical protein
MQQKMCYSASPCPANYLDAAYHINRIGIPALREYCESKPYPVHNFDRDMKIIRELLSGNSPAELSIKYGISRNTLGSIPRRYAKYAIICKKLIERKEQE